MDPRLCIQEDWNNRQFIETITTSIAKIADFLNNLDLSCRGQLSELGEKLTLMERKIDYLEAKIDKHEKK